MAIIVEDGSGMADSNSYASEAYLAAYALARGITIAGTAATLLIQAMDYIESLQFKGTKATKAQALQWPRYGVYIDGYYVDSDSIPSLLVDSTCEVALGIDAGVNPLATEERMTKQEVVGDISVTYMDGSRSTSYLVAAHAKLSKLLSGYGFGINARAYRA